MNGERWFPDIRSKKRSIRGTWAVVYSLAAAFMAVWYLYTSGFGVVSTETNRGFYLLFTAVLVFLTYPATSKSPGNRPSQGIFSTASRRNPITTKRIPTMITILPIRCVCID